jgi:fructuronate reductase
MNRLDDSAGRMLPRNIDVDGFRYDRDAQKVGIVHFGIGAFHRAHQAWYTDLAMDAGDRDWMIAGVSLRSPAVMAQLDPQHGLYTVTEQDGSHARTRLIGAIREVLVADRHSQAIVNRIASPDCRIVSFTVTEKGYCRNADGTLDPAQAERGFYPYLAQALARRRNDGLPGLTLLSCDNLAGNGRVLESLMGQYIAARQPDLAGWFAAECRCPATMVDRIVPATTPADLDAVQRRLGGIRDEGAVITEPFSQWVIEDRFAGPRPAWEQVGAQLVADVAPYETAKLRMLNGAHSLLAYCGLRRGHCFVHEAIADPALRALAGQLMRDEAAPTIAAAPGQDLAGYADALVERFANPALNHRLIQIAMDGSQKIPQRWLETLEANRRAGRACPAILAGLAAWLCHVRGDNAGRWGALDDPMAAPLAAAWDGLTVDAVIDALFGPAGMVSAHWTPTAEDRASLARLIAEWAGAERSETTVSDQP